MFLEKSGVQHREVPKFCAGLLCRGTERLQDFTPGPPLRLALSMAIREASTALALPGRVGGGQPGQADR